MQPQERIEALTETVSRSLEWAVDRAKRPGGLAIDELINETLYHERRRLRGNVHSPGKDDDRTYWKGVSRMLGKVSGEAQMQLLEQIVTRYADEIIGHFSPGLFNVITRYGSPSLSILLNSTSPLRMLARARHVGELDLLKENLTIEGEVETFLHLCKRGTVILTPTHVSNVDSVIMGYALSRLGLPPFLYGAGYNLFANPIIGPFLQRLGAYTVDREKKAPLYLQILKTYAIVSMEMGFHHIFFPGGTRSRSGKIEGKLKKGLLGCGLATYQHNLRAGKKDAKVFIVPCTLSYQMILEAETLVEDYLTEAGKARYIIIDDEFSRLDKLLKFARTILRHQSRIHMRIGEPLDPFGNRVAADGASIDRYDRIIDTAGYVTHNGQVVADAQRDDEFTNQLSERIVESFRKNNTVVATHAVAYALFEMLLGESPDQGLYAVLRERKTHPGFSIGTVRAEVSQLLQKLTRLAASGEIHLDPTVAEADPEEILSRALTHFTVYHASAAVERRGTRIFVRNRALLFYYRNRLTGYGLAKGVEA